MQAESAGAGAAAAPTPGDTGKWAYVRIATLLVALLIGIHCGTTLWHWYDMQTWPETTGTVEYAGCSTGGNSGLWSPNVNYGYTVGGVEYRNERMGGNRYLAFGMGEGFYSGDRYRLLPFGDESDYDKYPKDIAEAMFRNYESGQTVKVYYDPEHPSRSIIERGLTPSLVLVMLALGLLASLGWCGYAVARWQSGWCWAELAAAARGMMTPRGLARLAAYSALLLPLAIFAFLPSSFERYPASPTVPVPHEQLEQVHAVQEITLLQPWVVTLQYALAVLALFAAWLYGKLVYRGRLVTLLFPVSILLLGLVGSFVGAVAGPYGGIVLLVLLLAVGYRALGRISSDGNLLSYRYIAAVIILSPLVCSMRIGLNIAPWESFDRLTGPDGRTYWFMDSSFLQGQRLVIACDLAKNMFYSRRRVLGETNGDYPRSYIGIVRRAADRHEGYGQLYLSPDGLIIGVRGDNDAYMAYDPERRRFYGREEIGVLSPFVLIGQDDALVPEDVIAIMTAIRKNGHHGGDWNTRPDNRVFRQAGSHPNPAVRQAAQEIMAVWQEDRVRAERNRLPQPATGEE